MLRFFAPTRYLRIADMLVFILLGATIYAIVATGSQWRSDFHPITDIDLSLGALPKYAFFSTVRGLVAYCISLFVAIVFGYWAAKSRKAERLLVPLFDILQSVPPLGFLPALMVALITLFPRTNMGLELVAIIMIVTSQAWNMIFSFYYSLKGIPEDYKQAADIMGLSPRQRLTNIELPYAAVGLAWNSVISMANGWFFLVVCEAFTLGERDYRLPGVGSYMLVATKAGDTKAMFWGVLTMVMIIILLDFVIWRPVLSWVRKFRVEETNEEFITEPLMLLALKESRLIRWIQVMLRRFTRTTRKLKPISSPIIGHDPLVLEIERKKSRAKIMKIVEPILWVFIIAMLILGCTKLLNILAQVSADKWAELALATFYTFLRVFFAVLLSSLWAVPFGIWLGLSPRRTKIAQPIIQVMASFPAPMIYPLALKLFFQLGLGLDISATFLMMMGVQWYVLFNVLAGALRISQTLNDTLDMVPARKWSRWKLLYLPSIFPALVTGWVTATGGAWNASIVSEYVSFDNKTITANGLGSIISLATDRGDTPLLAASLTLMIGVVVILNRTFWLRLYTYSENKYRMD